ncbi:MAG: Sec-independent protein translocase protein TatB [Actinomycetes bacterium]
MFNVGGGEIIVILLIALIVLGPDKLPSAARQVGKYLNEFRRMSTGFQDEFRQAMEATPDPEPRPTPAPSGESESETATTMQEGGTSPDDSAEA